MRLFHAAAWIAGLVCAITYRILATRPEDVEKLTLGVEVLEEDEVEQEEWEEEEKDVEVNPQAAAVETCDISIFLLSPLTPTAVPTMKAEVETITTDRAEECKDKTWKVEVFTQSDTLRCGSKRALGGQLDSTIEACKVLLGEDEKEYFKFSNIFGDQFNQAWLAEEWGQMMDALWQFKKEKGMQLGIYIYPTQAAKNPYTLGALKEVLEPIVDPSDPSKPKLSLEAITEKWRKFTPMKKQYLMWCLTKERKLEFVYDLVTVVDYVLMKDPGQRQASMGAHGTPADWCVQKQPRELAKMYLGLQAEGLEDFDMTYIDLKSNNYTEFCQPTAQPTATRFIPYDNVTVAVPNDGDLEQKIGIYTEWVNNSFKKALNEMFDMEVGSDIRPSIDLYSSTDALIMQDTLDADNVISVVYLLSKVKFRSARMVLVSQLQNFKTHKFRGAPPRNAFSIIEDLGARVPNTGIDVEDRHRTAKVNFELMEPVYKQHFLSLEDAKPAWPMLVLEKQNNLEVAQEAKDPTDTELMRRHNWWRWEQFLRLYKLRERVELLDGGVPNQCPMSHVLVAYTFYFFNHDFTDKTTGSDFVLSLEGYEKLTDNLTEDGSTTDSENIFTEGIRENLKWVWSEVSSLASFYSGASDKLLPRRVPGREGE